jgi:NhaA family Na+:H+ antiporter
MGWGATATELDLRQVINDLLMPLFFFVVGLEIKRELTMGELASWKQAAMPVCVGIGGMVVPAAIYVGLNLLGDGNLNGWAVPVATDIAFALAVLVLLGDRVPAGLKALTLAFAAWMMWVAYWRSLCSTAMDLIHSRSASQCL